MLRNVFAATVAAAALIVAVPSHAVLLDGDFTVTAHSDPLTGLAIGTSNYFGTNIDGPTSSFTFLNVEGGGPAVATFIPLFELFAAESPPYAANDFVPQSITVAFNFTSGVTGSGIVTGTTVANINDEGELHWTGPINIGQHLTIVLSDAEFSDIFNGVVTAQISFVPEPGTFALLGLGLLGVLARRRCGAA